jgi:hypothetical protein
MKACVLAVVLGTAVLGLHVPVAGADETLPIETLLRIETPPPSALLCAEEQPEPCEPTPAPRARPRQELPAAADEPAAERPGVEPQLVVFWGVGCPRCEEAREFLAAAEAVYPGLEVEWVEARRDPEGRRRYLETMQRLGVEAAGVPTFVAGARVMVGFRRGLSEDELRGLIEASLDASGAPGPAPPADTLDLPMLGRIDWRSIPFPLFTFAVGLVDGFNPCAAWVLIVMLGLLLHVRSRARLVLFGGTFVVMSGVVYFGFMTAWAGLFALLGAQEWLTRLLGGALVLMGLINLKEMIWFKRGPSLMIPESAKAGLFRRMRHIAQSARLPTAFLGIAVLAFVVNLVELGCTLGLPAVYTRILSLQDGLSWGSRTAYLILYNVAYVIPLALIVLVYALTLHRFTLGDRSAKALKALSGVLLVLFGLFFALAPQAIR